MSEHTLERRRTEAAYTQSTFREVNRRIAEISRSLDRPVRFVCECLNPSCSETIAISREEYDRVRGHPARFFVLTGHEDEEIEETIERHGQYLVVQKLGAGAETAAELERRYTQAAE